MIALIHKDAPITFIEHLSDKAKDTWSLTNRARIPFYLETSSAQFTSFSAFVRLIELTQQLLTESEFVALIQTSSRKFVESVLSKSDKASLNDLCNLCPINTITMNKSDNFYSIELELQPDQPLFLAELYLLCVAHHYCQALNSHLKEPTRFHLQHPDAYDLTKLKINHRIPQFLGQCHSALFYNEFIQPEKINKPEQPTELLKYPLKFEKRALRYTEQIIAVLEGYIGREDITIEELSQIIQVNPRTIQRRLKNEATTFRKIKESLNMKFAKRVMIDRNASITDVAEHLGYADTPQFIRAFRKSENTTPLQWIKKHQNG